MIKYKAYFNSEEFDSPDLPGSGENMKMEFINQLITVRDLYNNPINISSGYRTMKHNKNVGGKSNSAHLRGYAADLVVNNSYERLMILRAVILTGFTRVGIANDFIHIDCDPSLPQNVLWKY